MAEKEVEAVKNGDEAAFERLAESFEPLIRNEVSRALESSARFGCDSDELRQDAMLALYEAALRYKPGNGVTFGLYAKICIRNRMISCIRKLASRARRAEKERFSSVEARLNAPEELMVSIEENSEFRTWLEGNLTAFERSVLRLYLQKNRYCCYLPLLPSQPLTVLM